MATAAHCVWVKVGLNNSTVPSSAVQMRTDRLLLSADRWLTPFCCHPQNTNTHMTPLKAPDPNLTDIIPSQILLTDMPCSHVLISPPPPPPPLMCSVFVLCSGNHDCVTPILTCISIRSPLICENMVINTSFQSPFRFISLLPVSLYASFVLKCKKKQLPTYSPRLSTTWPFKNMWGSGTGLVSVF